MSTNAHILITSARKYFGEQMKTSGKSVRQKATQCSTRPRINKVIECKHTRRRKCPFCRIGNLVWAHKVAKTTFDLKFTNSGVKRWIVKYVWQKKEVQPVQ